MNKIKYAYTLAEVLITLGIIGVVAAITIPGIIQNNKAARLRTQFLKSYSVIQQVFRQMEADEISLQNEDYLSGQYYKTLGKYLKGATYCGGQDLYGNPDKYNKPCFNHRKNKFKTLQGTISGINDWVNDGSLLLQDGSLLLFENGGSSNKDIIIITIDINGYGNPPDRLGHDVFSFQLINENIKPMGDKDTIWEISETYCNPKSTNKLNGIGCAIKAKNDPDYFKKISKQK